MALADEILAAAVPFLGETGEEEKAVLAGLCAAAETGLLARLRPGLSAESCGAAFVHAAAWIALSQYHTGLCADGVESFTAGDLRITKKAGAAVAGLREQAELLMAPYLADSFQFRGVRG